MEDIYPTMVGIADFESALAEHDTHLSRVKEENSKKHKSLDEYISSKKDLMVKIKEFSEVYAAARSALNLGKPLLFPEDTDTVTPAILADQFVECFPYMERELMAYLFDYAMRIGAVRKWRT